MEVFINDGRASVTRVNYPGEEDLGIAAFCENGCVKLKSLDVWKMKPIWWTTANDLLTRIVEHVKSEGEDQRVIWPEIFVSPE
jgi:hypothetical protein